MDNKTTLPLPTKFFFGIGPINLLSCELSLLSPITKKFSSGTINSEKSFVSKNKTSSFIS